MYLTVGIASQMMLIRTAPLANGHVKSNAEFPVSGLLVSGEEGAVDEDEDEDEDEDVEGVYMGSFASFHEPSYIQ